MSDWDKTRNGAEFFARVGSLDEKIGVIAEALNRLSRNVAAFMPVLERIASALEASDPPENPYDRVVLGLFRREPGIKWSTGAVANSIPDCDREALGLCLRDLEIRGLVRWDGEGWFADPESNA